MVWMESCKWLYCLKLSPQLFICMQLVECRLCLKWRILSRTGKIGSGKNTKYFFYYWAWSTPWGHVLSLKTFRQIPALSWAISNSVFQPVKFTSTLQKLLATFFQILDIWWSSLDIRDDFKLISRTAIFRFCEINNIMIFSFVKKKFFSLFLVRYYISNYKKIISNFFFHFF